MKPASKPPRKLWEYTSAELNLSPILAKAHDKWARYRQRAEKARQARLELSNKSRV